MLRSILCVALILWSGAAMALPLPEVVWGTSCRTYMEVDPATGYYAWYQECDDVPPEPNGEDDVEWTTDTECYDGYDAYDYP